MLPLVSSMTTTLIGCGLLSKVVSVCSLPLSCTSKSSCTRSGTRRLSASVTVAYKATVFVPALNVFCPASWALTEAMTAADAAIGTSIRMAILGCRCRSRSSQAADSVFRACDRANLFGDTVIVSAPASPTLGLSRIQPSPQGELKRGANGVRHPAISLRAGVQAGGRLEQPIRIPGGTHGGAGVRKGDLRLLANPFIDLTHALILLQCGGIERNDRPRHDRNVCSRRSRVHRL